MKRMFILFVLLTVATFAQVTVTFRVDLGAQVFRGLFNPSTDSVVVRGSFQADAGDPGGNWQGKFFTLTDGDGDTVYTVNATIPSSFAGTNYEFKFVKLPDGWEGTPNRTFTLAASGTQILPVYWFNDDSSYVVVQQVTNTINFTADLTSIYGTGIGYFDPATDSIQVMGLDWDGLGTVISGNRKMLEDPFQPKKFKTSMTIRGPLGDSTKWKFKTFPDARFTNTGWETGSDRWFKYVADGQTVTLEPIVPRIFPILGNLTQNVNVKFQVSMNQNPVNAHNGLPINPATVQWVGLKGGSAPIGNWGGNWVASDTTTGVMKILNDAGIDGDLVAGDKIFTDTVVFWVGIGAGAIEFKYAAVYPGADTVNGGTVPLDNEGGFGENHILILREPGPIVLFNNFGDFTTSVRELPGSGLVPSEFTLGQNYPNPFNPSTRLNYAVSKDGLVTLKVYNVMGEEVATLVNSVKPVGNYTIEWNASQLTSGIYFYTLTADNVSLTKKMILMK